MSSQQDQGQVPADYRAPVPVQQQSVYPSFTDIDGLLPSPHRSPPHNHSGPLSAPPVNSGRLPDRPYVPARASTLGSALELEHNKHDHDHDGDDLARSLAVQFYKIELGEQRRLMGVMEHHSKESAAAQPVLVTAPARSASLGQPQTQAKGAGVGGGGGVGGGVYGPIGGGGGVGMAGASRSEPAVNVVGGSKQKMQMQKMERSEEGTERGENDNDKEDRRETAVAAVETAAKALFPFSITAGVEQGNKNRCVRCGIDEFE